MRRHLKQKMPGNDAKDAAYTAVDGLQRALNVLNKVTGNLEVTRIGLPAVLAMIQVRHAPSCTTKVLTLKSEIAWGYRRHQGACEEGRRLDHDDRRVCGAARIEHIAPDAGEGQPTTIVSLVFVARL